MRRYQLILGRDLPPEPIPECTVDQIAIKVNNDFCSNDKELQEKFHKHLRIVLEKAQIYRLVMNFQERKIMMSKVTVVIPVYNYEKYIVLAIKSVLSQTYADWKLIIVDDNSDDNTSQFISEFLSDSRITYIYLQENQGTGNALNVALKLIDTPYFMILDADDWLDEEAIDILLDEMEQQPETTSTVSSQLNRWETNADDTRFIDLIKHRRFTKNEKYEFLLYAPMLYPRFLRTESVRLVNGFELDDPYKGRYGEDRYLLYKLIGISDFHYVNKPLYNRRIHNSNAVRSENRIKFVEAKKYVIKKILNLWGNEFEPIWSLTTDGWLALKLKALKDDLIEYYI